MELIEDTDTPNHQPTRDININFRKKKDMPKFFYDFSITTLGSYGILFNPNGMIGSFKYYYYDALDHIAPLPEFYPKIKKHFYATLDVKINGFSTRVDFIKCGNYAWCSNSAKSINFFPGIQQGNKICFECQNKYFQTPYHQNPRRKIKIEDDISEGNKIY